MPQAKLRLLLLLLVSAIALPAGRVVGDAREVDPDPIRVPDWLVAGPFSIGSREALVDPVWPVNATNLVPSAGDSIASMMAPGGWARWLPVAGRQDTVTFAYEGVDWDGLSGQWGSAGVLCAGLAFGAFETTQSGTYRIEAAGIGSLYIDGLRYLGNPYGSGALETPVRLEKGRHRVLLRVSGGGPRESRFQLHPAEETLSLLVRDLTLPDLVAGEPCDAWGAAPIVNLTGRDIRGAALEFGDGTLIEKVSVPIPPLPPEGILKIPFRVKTVPTSLRAFPGPAAEEQWRGEIRIAFHAEEKTAAETGDKARLRQMAFPCSLRVRPKGASRIVTFLSAQDGSVQKYAVLPPSIITAAPGGGTSAKPDGSASQASRGDGSGSGGGSARYALILSLHGASVEPQPQVDSYSQKDWAYVVAPTNRRPFGFDWQDWGRVSAIETLDDAILRYSIDTDRVVLTGHSMGGHGTWHVGLAHADRFAALAPSAGWASFGSYMPFTLRRDAATAEPSLRAIWERTMAPDNPLSFLRNARGIPAFVLHGEKDDNVPVFQGRLLAQRAREEGVRVVYREAPGMNHWWDRPETPGVDCVDDPEMMKFLKEARRTPAPDTVSLCTFDLDTCDRSHWLVVDEALHPFARVEAEGRILDPPERGFLLRTSGVGALTVDPAGHFGAGKIRIAIDSDRLWADGGGPVRMRFNGKRWRIVDANDSGAARGGDGARPASEGRSASGRGERNRFRGPLKRAFFEPFVLVYGTRGDPEAVLAMRRLAVLDSQNWYLRADGFAPVLPDTAITPEIASTRNLILYALPGTNAVLESIARRLPVRIEHDCVAVGRKRYRGGGLAARFVSANPSCPDRLVEVVAGTDPAGLDLAAAANPCYSGSGYPDFVVFDASVRLRGWGGMKAAGFFDARGRVASDGADAYFR